MTTSSLLSPLTLPTNHVATWLANRTASALERAKTLVAALKAGTNAGTLDVLSRWNDIELALSNVAAVASTFLELHPDISVRNQCEATLQEVDRLSTKLSLDAELYEVFTSADPTGLPTNSARLLDDTLRDFRRSGVDKDDATRARIADISERMVAVGQTFARNIRDDVRSIRITPERLAGLPADWIDEHPATAGLITITTDYPDAIPFFTFAHDAQAREELRFAFLNRGWPANDSVLMELFALRREFAELVGYPTWADYDAEIKMIGSGAAIKEFVDSVTAAARPSAERDLAILLERVRQDRPDAQSVGLADKDYYAELLRKERFGVDAAQVRMYFDFSRVLEGMLAITSRLFDLRFTRAQVRTWHEDVMAYDVHLVADSSQLLGRAYLDLHPREGKFGHAAQFDLVSGVAGVQVAEGVLGCNFGRGLLNHDEVVTLFHEFGHLIHHLLASQGEYVRFSGVATEWDFVEAPSQMLEEWAWDPEVLQSFAVNADGEPIPVGLVADMKAADEFGKGYDVLTQMFYAAMSYTFHVEQVSDLTSRMVHLQEKYSVFDYLPDTHMMASFGHLDGYSSSYYTYMWSLVIAKDMFSMFKADLFDPDVATRYRNLVLAPGGSQNAAALVEEFLGRPYNLEEFHQWLAS